MNPKTPKRIYAEKLCLKHREDGPDYIMDRPLGKILYSKFPNDFNRPDAARSMVRTIRGHNGNNLRICTTNKSLMTETRLNKITTINNKKSENYE